MGLFWKSKEERRERKETKKQIKKLMKQYDKEEIDGPTYMKKMMGLSSSHRNK